jgi:hypothetical protein
MHGMIWRIPHLQVTLNLGIIFIFQRPCKENVNLVNAGLDGPANSIGHCEEEIIANYPAPMHFKFLLPGNAVEASSPEWKLRSTDFRRIFSLPQ